MAKLRDCLKVAGRKLAGLPGAGLEAEILLAHALESPRSFLYANPELELPSHRVNAFRKLVRRRRRGEPIAYITGSREFWSLQLKITPDVLIPRHDTESLVQAALELIPMSGEMRIADLGTGSGAIALAIASERPECEIHATDSSRQAIDLAAENARRLRIDNACFHHGHWYEPLTGEFNLVVSNPPYVAAGDPHLEQGDCRFEPHESLTPGSDPLTAIREIADRAPSYLQPGGWLLFEHGAKQGPAVRRLLERLGLKDIATSRDLAGHERVTFGIR